MVSFKTLLVVIFNAPVLYEEDDLSRVPVSYALYFLIQPGNTSSPPCSIQGGLLEVSSKAVLGSLDSVVCNFLVLGNLFALCRNVESSYIFISKFSEICVLFFF
jgi:hypothetical protein